jgi:hypothetical protein
VSHDRSDLTLQVVEVVKKEKLMFDLVTPNRLYHLQAFDEVDYEHWTMTIMEWILYFKLVAIEVCMR